MTLRNVKTELLVQELSNRQGSLESERAKLLARIADIDRALEALGALNGAEPVRASARRRTKSGRKRRFNVGVVARVVQEALSQGPGTASEIHARARKKAPGLQPTQVYRRLSHLATIRAVDRAGEAGEYRYTLTG